MARPFVARWRSEEGTALVTAVLERLADGAALVGLGLEMTDAGLFDLRGLTLPAARVGRRGEAAGSPSRNARAR
jgi:hypothetical protein